MKQTFETYTKLMLGLEFLSEEPVDWTTPSEDELSTAKYMVSSLGAGDILRNCQTFQNFKSLCPDIGRVVNSEEVFYSLKNGYSVKEVPAKLIYFCRKAVMQSCCPSVVPLMLGDTLLKQAFTKGYLKDGWSTRDVIKTFCDSNFVFLTEVGSSYVGHYGADFLYSLDGPVYWQFPKEFVSAHNLSKFKVTPNGYVYDENGQFVGDMK